MPASNDFNVWATLKRVYGLWFRKDGFNLKLTPSGSTLTADRTINLPNANADTTLMTTDGAQEVSNKIFTDSVNIQDPGVGTHTISLVAPTLSASYTLTLPTTDGAANQYLQTDGSGGLSWVTPPGSGDVAGPSASVDNAIVRFNGTGGKTIQDYTSGAPTISDTGDITLAAGKIINVDELNGNSTAGIKVKGRTDGAAVAAGYVGEVKNATQTGTMNPTSGQWSDLVGAGLTLTAGLWRVTLYLYLERGSATITDQLAAMGITTSSGNTGTGIVYGQTAIPIYWPTTTTPTTGGSISLYIRCDGSNCILSNGGSLTGVTLYSKIYCAGFTGTVAAKGNMEAVRIA